VNDARCSRSLLLGVVGLLTAAAEKTFASIVGEPPVVVATTDDLVEQHHHCCFEVERKPEHRTKNAFRRLFLTGVRWSSMLFFFQISVDV